MVSWNILAIELVELVLLVIVAAASVSVLVGCTGRGYRVVVVALLGAAAVVDEFLALEYRRQLFGYAALLWRRGECLGTRSTLAR